MNKKDIESDDEDFIDEEDFEEEETTSDEAETDDEITSEVFELYEEYDINKVAYLLKNFDFFSDKIYNKCKNNEELKNETNKCKNWLEYIINNDGKIKVDYKSDGGRSHGKKSIQTISGYVRIFY